MHQLLAIRLNDQNMYIEQKIFDFMSDFLAHLSISWSQKLGHRAKSAENLVNTLAVTFLKQSS